MENVTQTGRQALAETGQLLHVIRDRDGELGLAPTPSMDRLDELIAAHRAAGLEVDLRITGPLPNLAPGADVSAYRIVQEALTNAARHSADGKLTLSIEAVHERMIIRTSNWIGRRNNSVSGLGLVGIAERVDLVGGQLSHGVTADGKFELAVTIPSGNTE